MVKESFIQLQRNCSRDMSALPEYRIAVVGDFSTQLLAQAVRGYGFGEGIRFDVFDADFDQIEAQVLDEESDLYRHRPQAVLLALCAERLYERFCRTPRAERAAFAQTEYGRIHGAWEQIKRRCGANILQPGFVEYDDAVFGSYAGKTDASFFYQIKKLNLLLLDGCREEKKVFPIDLNGICLRLGMDRFRDDKQFYGAKMPLSTRILPDVAKAVTDVCRALMGKSRKCIVTDLDNTLWGGVIGDDGMDGIELGELGGGAVFTALQQWLKELKDRGILLAVCSKNDASTAREPFNKHPDMVLRLDDFSMFVANWDDKATNLSLIQKTLNIGMDSIVFLDDNPYERELVRGMLPDVTVPDLPDDPAAYLRYLQNLNLFETASFTDEDYARTGQYRAEAQRAQTRRGYASFDDYLKSLEMVAEAKPFDAFHFPRIAQLTQRSNQFNLRTVRYSEGEIQAIAADPKYRTLYFTLKDRFGDNGLIGVVILECREKTLFINEWLMSCRVLKRGMEEFIVNAVMNTARREGFRTVEGEYLPTAKNAMVADLYERMGFSPIGDGRFRACADAFRPLPCFIAQNK